MQFRHDVELPCSEDFYTKSLGFEVKVDSSACGSFTGKDGSTFSLEAPGLLAGPLSSVNNTVHQATLEQLSEAALRFYRSDTVGDFSVAEYIDVLFWTRYQWGMAFEENSKSSIKHRFQGKLHPEALRAQTEQFGYGLSIHFVAKLLGIPIDRFFFIDAAGSRPDFYVQISAAELAASSGGNIAALSADGHQIQLEVKARTGWASYRTGSDDGLSLLRNLSLKAASKPEFATISLLVSLPNKDQTRATFARILVADPGDPPMREKKDQVLLLLDAALPLLVRHGLWPTLSSALQWIQDLRGDLNDGELPLLKFIQGHSGRAQYSIVTKVHDGRTFNGRIFSDVVLHLGRVGERRMSQSEAQSRLETDDLGRAWFSGADKNWMEIVQKHDGEGLLTYGLGGHGQPDLSGHSAFLLLNEPMTDEIRASVRNELKNALRRW